MQHLTAALARHALLLPAAMLSQFLPPCMPHQPSSAPNDACNACPQAMGRGPVLAVLPPEPPEIKQGCPQASLGCPTSTIPLRETNLSRQRSRACRSRCTAQRPAGRRCRPWAAADQVCLV